jgi:hypothetical protein
LWLELEAGRKRARREYERDVTLAFLTEFMARQDKLGADSMRKVLPKAARRKQTLAEQRVVVKEIQNRYGLTPYFRPHPRRTEAR